MKCDSCDEPIDHNEPRMFFPDNADISEPLTNCHVTCGMVAYTLEDGIKLRDNLKDYFTAISLIIQTYRTDWGDGPEEDVAEIIDQGLKLLSSDFQDLTALLGYTVEIARGGLPSVL